MGTGGKCHNLCTNRLNATWPEGCTLSEARWLWWLPNNSIIIMAQHNKRPSWSILYYVHVVIIVITVWLILPYVYFGNKSQGMVVPCCLHMSLLCYGKILFDVFIDKISYIDLYWLVIRSGMWGRFDCKSCYLLYVQLPQNLGIVLLVWSNITRFIHIHKCNICSTTQIFPKGMQNPFWHSYQTQGWGLVHLKIIVEQHGTVVKVFDSGAKGPQFNSW